MKQSEDGNELVIRLFEVNGEEATVNLKVPVEVSKARRMNLVELPLINTSEPIISGKTIQVKIKPHEIVTLGITTMK
jgi:alpha-mannosidase